jgi:putative DNA primase/helicase
MNLHLAARALGGEVSGRQVICPGPGHSRRDRSLSVRLEPSAPDGFLVHSHAGDDWRTCRDHVRTLLGLPTWQPGDEQNRNVPTQHSAKWDLAAVEEEANDMIRTEDDLIRIKSAQKIWDSASEHPDQRVFDYLASRALDPPKELFGPHLRFHAQCPFRNEDTGKTDLVPA